jgi:hypothetical protein
MAKDVPKKASNRLVTRTKQEALTIIVRSTTKTKVKSINSRKLTIPDGVTSRKSEPPSRPL